MTDGAGTSLDRTREGYVEIIEMGDILVSSTIADRSHARRRYAALHRGLTDAIASTDTVVGPAAACSATLRSSTCNATAEYTADAVALDN